MPGGVAGARLTAAPYADQTSLLLAFIRAGESSANPYDINNKTQSALCLKFPLSPVSFTHRQKAKSPGFFSRGGGHTKMEGASSICDETIKQFVFPELVSASHTSDQSVQNLQR